MNASNAEKEDISARILTLPAGTRAAAIARLNNAATHGVWRSFRTRAKMLGISPSRPKENTSLEVATNVMRTVLAVAKSAIALRMLPARGQTFSMAIAKGAWVA